MTTTVNVSAHCASNLQVVVSATGAPDVVLQNGEAVVVYAYDNRVISVKESAKGDQPVAQQAPNQTGFLFPLQENVKIKISGEVGVISGRAEYSNVSEPQYRLKYVNGAGTASEGWFDQSDLTAG